MESEEEQVGYMVKGERVSAVNLASFVLPIEQAIERLERI